MSQPAGALFDLTPTDDQQALVETVRDVAAEVVRPAAREADDATATPAAVLAAGDDLGLSLLGVPTDAGGLAEERSAMTTTLVAEALAHGDLGIAVALLAPGSVATSLALWGDPGQQAAYLPRFAASTPPIAALALTEPRPLFDVLAPKAAARRRDGGYVLDGVKSAVPRGAEADLLLVGAQRDDGSPGLFLVDAGRPGVSTAPDPAMGVRAAALSRVVLEDVHLPTDALLGRPDGSTYVDCVRLARLAWCALAVGTAQAVLDHVTPYVKEREAFGEPIAHRQSVAFMVADLAIELQAMRLVTYKAAARVTAGRDAGREIALARQLCGRHGMRIGLDGVQLLGGHGFVKEHPVERWYRDLRAVAVMEGGVMV